MKNLALAAAAAVALTMAVASASAAGRHGVSTEAPPMGDQGARNGGLCWVVGSGGVSTYHGYWAPCK